MHEEHWVMKLTDLAILPKVGRDETILGTLEAHLNGFIYTASGHPMKVGTKETKDIQFYLVPTPQGQVRSDEKDEQTRDSSRNEDLKNFVHKAQEAQRTCGSRLPYSIPIRFQALEECEFYGASSTGASVIFAVAKFSLVVLEETPFLVIPFEDIEIVNLAHLGPGKIDMTAVFGDFKHDVLEIRSIPLEFLTSIKHRLNSAGYVKYYVNNKSLNWSSLVKEIAEFRKRFLDSGGWDSLCLEDSLTLAYYPSAYYEQLASYARYEKYKNTPFVSG
ncbi:hypothetical protein MKX01_015445 [Papaver californicum]|nr:hypothetical protein MKX01_015445 [Papaver californicum]